LEIVKLVLLALLDEYPNLEILMPSEFRCFADVKHPRFKVVGRWVDIMSYPSMMKGWDIDIGIAPLRDNQFNRAKSNLRWLEYSSMKVPTVASYVRPFSESITEDGILCRTRQDWHAQLKRLIEDKNERERIGLAAYEKVKTDFNMEKVTKQYRSILEEIKRS
jgi:glycosyltransferase involved in cell wall biosynthesis